MNELKKLRLKLKLSQSDLAVILNIPKSYVSYYENGILKPNKSYLDDIINMCKTKANIERIKQDLSKNQKFKSHFNNEMYSPVRTIEYCDFTFIFERVIINNEIMFSIKLYQKRENQFKVLLSVSELNSFLNGLYRLLESEFLSRNIVCGGNIKIGRWNIYKKNNCIFCGEKKSLIFIEIQGNMIVVCEKCAEKIYYQLDDLSFDYINGEPF